MNSGTGKPPFPVGLGVTDEDYMQPSYQRKRRAQIRELLREKISLILMHKSRDPRLRQLSVTDVKLSDDFRRARVFYILRTTQAPPMSPEADAGALSQAQDALNKAVGFVKQEIAQLHILRLMPQITFEYDASWRQGDRIDRLLRQISSTDESLNDL